MAIDWAEVTNPQRFKEGVWLVDHFTKRSLHALYGSATKIPDQREAGNQFIGPALATGVRRLRTNFRHGSGEARNRRCIRPAVIIENDQHFRVCVAEIVEALVCHATSHGTVADNGNDPTILLALGFDRFGYPVRIRKYGRRVAVFDPVVLRFLAIRIARKSAGFAELGELGLAARDHFVDIGLMAGIPQQNVAW